MNERQLATIRKIAEIKPIENADAIEAIRVDGWWVVAKKGEYKVGDLAVYLEVDSWVPTELAPFLTKPGHEPKEFEGVKGERLRTIKLRGQLSQGLLLPTHNDITGKYIMLYDDELGEFSVSIEEGDDVTEVLGILKYEKPIPAQLAGMVEGAFPSFIPKTDQPRIQNCTRQFEKWKEEAHEWEITEKLDGSSMTVYVHYPEEPEDNVIVKYGVCSRNYDLKFDENNTFWKTAIENKICNRIASTGRSLAVQGELVGPGIQGNSYKFSEHRFFVYDIYDIEQQKYLLPYDRQKLCNETGLDCVPTMPAIFKMDESVSIDDLLDIANGNSFVTETKVEREGFVFKSMTEHDVSFKVISNKWLLKNE